MTAEQAMTEALEAVYGGDQTVEAGALIDQLLDRGYRVVACRRQVESFDDVVPGSFSTTPDPYTGNPTGRLTG